MIHVLICDDHQIVRQGIKQMLCDASDIALAGEADCGPEALRQVRATRAPGAAPAASDVVLMDIAMPQPMRLWACGCWIGPCRSIPTSLPATTITACCC